MVDGVIDAIYSILWRDRISFNKKLLAACNYFFTSSSESIPIISWSKKQPDLTLKIAISGLIFFALHIKNLGFATFSTH
jgi:hypothetical protein